VNSLDVAAPSITVSDAGLRAQLRQPQGGAKRYLSVRIDNAATDGVAA
jgi:hypothetical protein